MQKQTPYSNEAMTSEKSVQIAQTQETFQLLNQISQLLVTGLDPESLALCIRLCDLGVNPESLAHVVREIRKMAVEEPTAMKDS